MDRGAWWATVHGVAKSQTRLSIQHSLIPEATPLTTNATICVYAQSCPTFCDPHGL